MIEFIVLETQGKLGVVMLAMHDINKYISSTYSYLGISFMIEIAFVINFFDNLLWPQGELDCISCQPYESLLAGLVELFYTHMVSIKVLRCTSWGR
jgi:hypothetical protein